MFWIHIIWVWLQIGINIGIIGIIGVVWIAGINAFASDSEVLMNVFQTIVIDMLVMASVSLECGGGFLAVYLFVVANIGFRTAYRKRNTIGIAANPYYIRRGSLLCCVINKDSITPDYINFGGHDAERNFYLSVIVAFACNADCCRANIAVVFVYYLVVHVFLQGITVVSEHYNRLNICAPINIIVGLFRIHIIRVWLQIGINVGIVGNVRFIGIVGVYTFACDFKHMCFWIIQSVVIAVLRLASVVSIVERGACYIVVSYILSFSTNTHSFSTNTN